MKRILCLAMGVGLLAVVGCQKSNPEDAARAFVDRQITAHKGFELDTSELEYKTFEQEGDTAKVLVTGDIEVKGEVNLVKKNGKWVVGESEPALPGAEAPQETAGHPKTE